MMALLLSIESENENNTAKYLKEKNYMNKESNINGHGVNINC
jgi:hypothetical protein